MKITAILFILILIQNTLSRFLRVQRFSDILASFQKHPNKLATALISSFDDCKNCEIAHQSYISYALQNEDMVNAFLVDCSELWQFQDDRDRLPSCDPEQKQHLPHFVFFQPGLNKRLPKSIPYEGILSPDAIQAKTKEYMPNFIKDISSVKQLNQFLSNTQIQAKALIFVKDYEDIPMQYIALSGAYKGQIEFGSFDLNTKNIYQKYNITNLPSLVFVTNEESQGILYQDELDYHKINEFLNNEYTKGNFEVKKINKKEKKKVFFDVSNEVVVNKANFDQLQNILKKNKENLVLIHLYKEEYKTNKIFQQIQNDFKNVFVYYEIQCFEDLCEQEFKKIQQFPTVILYGLKKTPSDRWAIDKYDQTQFSYDLIENVLKPSFYNENLVKSEDQLRQEMQKGVKEKKFTVYYFLDINDVYNRAICLYISTHRRFRKHLHFVTFFNPLEASQDLWGARQGLPYVGAVMEILEEGTNYKRQPYEYNEINYSNLIDYFNILCNIKLDKFIINNPIQEIKTYEDYENICQKNSKVCILGIFSGLKQGKLKNDLDVLQEVRTVYYDKDYDFTYIDGTCHIEILKSFKLQQNQLNTVIYIDQDRKKYAVLNGQFNLNSISEFIEKINNKKLTQFAEDIDIDDRDCESFNKANQEKKQQEQQQQQKRKNKRKDEL
ncbi:thioredoxin domain protein [Ichthyophthirius multifiliis]|uniref:Thioredoxin domain protein n=1 Tax=Ichthyophthirius multifiliis TaxID=5932 RepID=G0QK44_ICHMU|nr:thioredoxin domain protein [Ichthyophthirius multifiliis]EGR34414.1 thioredoxin domain protein [Ichthyophthirius multifiliis]|eukprot:XP_004039718.1 thioredoxin domain protein [Ichthyophthirius multifiliis]